MLTKSHFKVSKKKKICKDHKLIEEKFSKQEILEHFSEEYLLSSNWRPFASESVNSGIINIVR